MPHISIWFALRVFDQSPRLRRLMALRLCRRDVRQGFALPYSSNL